MARIGLKTSRLPINYRFRDTIILIKRASGSYGTDGLYTPGVQETTVLEGHHQPANEDDRQNLPENERIRESKKFWIKSDQRDLIRPMRQGVNNTPGDILQINGINYEVYSVDNFSLNDHISGICMRVENQNG